MSEIREKLLGSSALRSRAIKVVALSIILISAFAFSTAFISLIFGSQRFVPSDSITDAEYEDVVLTPIPFPWDIMDFLDFLDNLGLELDPEDLDALMDMFDGVPDGLDLSQFGSLLLAALFSEVEVFRVYNYSSIIDMEDVLWKYECFDEYNSGSWETSITPDNYDFYSYSDKSVNYPGLDLYTVKLLLNMTPNVGEQNTFSVPSLFPTPFIMENSVSAPYLVPSSTILRKQPGVVSGIEDGLNSTAIIAEFSSSTGTNISYELFGLDLPSSSVINSSAIRPNTVTSPSAGYTSLKNHYIDTFNGGPIGNFISTYSDFAYHYNYLSNNVIDPSDNSFIIADKIRNYLQYNFNLTYDPAPDTDDPINYFCQVQGGLYSEFASAFCAFTRAFGVASRFVDGFNSRSIEEIYDSIENDFGFAVKYRNMYNWAEIYVPTDASGNGYWVQMDVYYDNFMGNPPTPIFGDNNFTLSVWTPYKTNPVNRGTPVTITATLLNNSIPVQGETISFTDVTTNTPLPSNTTNFAGIASITVPVNNTSVVGPHVIKAVYNPTVANATHYLVNGPINVTLTSVTPQEVNISETPHDIQVQGYVYDPIALEYVKYSDLNFVMLRNGTSTVIPNAFIPFYTTTDENGDFDVTIEVSSSISPGDRQIMANFSGTWNYTITHLGMDFPYPITAIPGSITNSSNRWYLNITKAKVYNLTLFIANQPPNNLNAPIVNRYNLVQLKAVVLNETGGPISGELVSFYNYTGGDTFIGSATTNGIGEAFMNIIPGYNSISGPNLLYAQLGGEINYSYYILNETPNITITSGPTPLVINKSAGEEFTVVGYLRDGVNLKPLNYSEVELKIFRGGVDYTSNLTGGANPFATLSDGGFSVTFGVDPAIPPGNYTVRLDFNGSYDLSSFPYSNDFTIPYLSTTEWSSNELQITYQAPLHLHFWINGTESDNWNNPKIYRNDGLNLTALLMLGDTPLTGNLVEFWDVTQDNLFIGSIVTDINGYAMLNYETNSTTVAGPHLIYAKYGGNYNYSYFILDSPIIIDLDNCPEPRTVNCTTSLGRTFEITGIIRNSTSGAPIKYGTVSVHLFDGALELTPLSNFLTLIAGSYNCNATGQIFLRYYVESSLAAKNYTLQVWFNGTFLYSPPNNVFNPHDFIQLQSLSNNFTYSAPCSYQLDVSDPENVTITLSVEGYPTPYAGSSYWDLNKPQRYNRWDEMHIQVRVNQDGVYPTSGTVYLYNDYTGATLDSYVFDGSETPAGFVQFNVSTGLFHAGLYRLRVQYQSYGAHNKTYIIINETVSISHNQNNLKFMRGNAVNQIISGTVTDPWNLDTVRGLRVTIRLLNSDLSDVSALYLNLAGSQTVTISASGTYSFTISSINSACPQGKYYLRIDFNGSLNDNWLFLSDYMKHSNSSLINLNVTADTYIFDGYYYTENFNDRWYQTDTLWVNGTLRWDNGTGIAGMTMTIEVRSGVTVLNTSYGVTDSTGHFGIDIEVGDWPDNTEVWVYFYPNDPSNFGVPDGYYVEEISEELFRNPSP